jgi:hypothetical protein
MDDDPRSLLTSGKKQGQSKPPHIGREPAQPLGDERVVGTKKKFTADEVAEARQSDETPKFARS